MARSAVRITDAWLARDQKPGLHWCKRHTCLGVRVGKSGTKAFVYQKGGGKRLTLGRIGELTLAKAQENAADLNKTGVAAGTLGEAFELWARRHRVNRNAEGTISNRRLQLTKWLDWEMPLTRVNHAWAQKLQLSIAENSIWAANDVIRHTRTMYRVATGSDWPFVLPPISTKGLKKQSKRRLMGDPSVWWQTVQEAESEVIHSYWLMIALTGLREAEVRESRWEYLGEGWLHVYNAKGGEPFDRPVPKQLMAILPPVLSDWIFPGIGPKGHLVNPKPPAIRHLCSEHAIRHWWRTVAEVDAEAPFPVVQALMNHSEKRGTTDVYGVKPDRLEEWSQRIADVVAEKIGL